MSKATRKPRFDFVSLGESMLRLSVPTGRRLDDTRSLDMELAGAESNVSVALVRLGWRTGWVSRMADHALANAILRALAAGRVTILEFTLTGRSAIEVVSSTRKALGDSVCVGVGVGRVWAPGREWIICLNMIGLISVAS